MTALAIAQKYSADSPVQSTLAMPNEHHLSEVLTACQSIVDITSSACQVPAVLVMRKNTGSMEVISSSQHPLNPYQAGDRDIPGNGRYCETVV